MSFICVGKKKRWADSVGTIVLIISSFHMNFQNTDDFG